ncbi:MAG: hypothetical protein KF756_05585 [Acidobacteria bacterium]|nr:hypothetical protein [Acidobacteriota bacterium]
MSHHRIELICYFCGILFAAAFAYFLWQSDFDWTFASFILAVSMFFLGYRFRLKARIDARQTPQDPPISHDEIPNP